MYEVSTGSRIVYEQGDRVRILASGLGKCINEQAWDLDVKLGQEEYLVVDEEDGRVTISNSERVEETVPARWLKLAK